jgi:hypothetical protein
LASGVTTATVRTIDCLTLACTMNVFGCRFDDFLVVSLVSSGAWMAGAVGTFFEGVMTSGFSSDETDRKVHANIMAANYKLVGT